MVRRRYLEQKQSRLALWARRLALFSLAATLLTGVIVHLDLLEVRPALATLGAALSFAVLGIVLALGALVVIWVEGAQGLGRALAAIGIGLVILGYPAYLGVRAYSLPPISDITTDPINPPGFDIISQLRPRDANPILYTGLYAAELQRKAYPEVEPLTLQVTPDAAYKEVMKLVHKRKWRVIDAQPPSASRPGTVEAIARTLFMGFRDDISIRVRADTDGVRVDMRSASRYGRYDFGVNAGRITGFLSDLESAVEAQLPEHRDRDDRKTTPTPKRKPRTARER